MGNNELSLLGADIARSVAALMAKQEAMETTEDTFDIGDLVMFTADEVEGYGGIEAIDTEAGIYTVRLYARAGTEFEPTDKLYNVPFSDIMRSEDVDDDDIAEGDAVEYESEAGAVKGIVEAVGDSHITLEVYARHGAIYEPTGVAVSIPSEAVTKTEPFAKAEHAHRIMAKIKDLKMYEGDDPNIGMVEGMASAYGMVDFGGDTIAKGAYTQTIQHNGGSVPLLLDHSMLSSDVAGVAYLADEEMGLGMKAEMDLRDPKVKTVYDKIKFLADRGKKMGLSIGYRTVKADRSTDGTRVLKEIALHEISITPFPMDTHARITAVKARRAGYAAKAEAWGKTVTRRKAVEPLQDAYKALEAVLDRQLKSTT